MNGALRKWTWIALLLLSGSTLAQSTRSVEVPINQAGEVQVAEIVGRLAQASGAPLEKPVASLSLSNPGPRSGSDQDTARRDTGSGGRDRVSAG